MNPSRDRQAQLLPFTYQDQSVRVVRIDGEPWFVLADLCGALGINNGRMVADRLAADVNGVSQIDTPGGRQSMTVVSEPGMYEVVIRSDKPEAASFRRWITSEVLPQIRKTGHYDPSQDRVKIGAPVRTLPGGGTGRRGRPGDHWWAVAAAAKQHPGMWLPVVITWILPSSLKRAGYDIRNNRLPAFRSGSWDAAFRRGKLFVRFASGEVAS